MLQLEAPWVTNAGYEPEPDDGVICDRCKDKVYDWFDIDGAILCDDCFGAVCKKWRRHSGEWIG